MRVGEASRPTSPFKIWVVLTLRSLNPLLHLDFQSIVQRVGIEQDVVAVQHFAVENFLFGQLLGTDTARAQPRRRAAAGCDIEGAPAFASVNELFCQF